MEIVITITQRGTDADGNIPQCPEKNPYAGLTQSQVVALLIESNVRTNVAPEIKVLIEGAELELNANSIQINRNQKRQLNKFQNTAGEITFFEYVEGYTMYVFSDGVKRRETLEDDDFWEKPMFWSNETTHFENFDWSV